MLEEDYCSKELTKLLLKKGCPLNKVYKKVYNLIYYTKPEDDVEFQDCDAYYIPTHSQVMRWLREEKQIEMQIRLVNSYKTHTPIQPPSYQVDILDYRTKNKWIDNDLHSTHYWGIVEEGIKYILENLI